MKWKRENNFPQAIYYSRAGSVFLQKWSRPGQWMGTAKRIAHGYSLGVLSPNGKITSPDIIHVILDKSNPIPGKGRPLSQQADIFLDGPLA
jgi:hypothetical protein